MKTLTVMLPDEIYDRAERRAAERGASLPGEVADLVKQYTEEHQQSVNGQDKTTADLGRLFAALDAGRNVVPVGSLSRNDLYDRPVLH